MGASTRIGRNWRTVARLPGQANDRSRLVGGKIDGQPPDVFLASDDEDAKNTVRQLVENGGLRAIDAGPLTRAHELEALGYLHMALQQPLGTGFSSSVKVLA